MRTQARGDRTRDRIMALLRQRDLHRPSGPAPTVREISKALGLSVATVHRHIRVLAQLGQIEYEPGMARTIRVRSDA